MSRARSARLLVAALALLAAAPSARARPLGAPVGYQVDPVPNGVRLATWGAEPLTLRSADGPCSMAAPELLTSPLGLDLTFRLPATGPCARRLTIELSGAEASATGPDSFDLINQAGSIVGRVEGVQVRGAEGQPVAAGLRAEGSRVTVSALEASPPLEVIVSVVPELGLAPDGKAPARSLGTDAAFDGTHFLVVWQQGGGTPAIWGARFTADGRLLDPEGLLLSALDVAATHKLGPPAVTQERPGVFRVAWPETRGRAHLIKTVLVRARDGTVLDRRDHTGLAGGATNRIVMARGTARTLLMLPQSSPLAVLLDREGGVTRVPLVMAQDRPSAIAYGKGVFLVVWTEERLARVLATRIDERTGRVLDETPLLLSREGLAEAYGPLSAAALGDRALVAWTGAGDVRGAQVSLPTGRLLGERSTLLAPSAGPLELAANGERFVLTWLGQRAPAPLWAAELDPRTLDARLVPEGALPAGVSGGLAAAASPAGLLLASEQEAGLAVTWLDRKGRSTTRTLGAGRMKHRTVAFAASDTRLLVLSEDGGSRSVVRVLEDGRPVQERPLRVACRSESRADWVLDADAGGSLLVCPDQRGRLTATHFGADGAPEPPRVLSKPPEHRRWVAALRAPEADLVAWTTAKDSAARVQAVVLPRAGHDAEVIDLGPAAGVGDPLALAHHRGAFVVAWQHKGRLLARRLNGSGVPLEAEPLELPSFRSGSRPYLVSAGDLLIVSAVEVLTPESDGSRARVLHSFALAALDQPPLLRWSFDPGWTEQPDLALRWDGRHLVTCWTGSSGLECRFAPLDPVNLQVPIAEPRDGLHIGGAALIGTAALSDGRTALIYRRASGRDAITAVRVVGPRVASP